MQRWFEAATRADDPEILEFAQTAADDDRGAPLLHAIFGNSPFLGRCLLADMNFTRRLFSTGPDLIFEDILAEIDAGDDASDAIEDLMQSLRIARRRIALTIGLADICGAWGLEKSQRHCPASLNAPCARLAPIFSPKPSGQTNWR